MLGSKSYNESVSYTSSFNRVEERELVFDFEPVSIYYKGTIKIKYHSSCDAYISNMLVVTVIIHPPGGKTPIFRRTVALRSKLSRHIETITGRTLSF